ncbi:MAG: hypothetical protein ABUS47_04650 [Steroidobacter sp.]
MARLLSYVAQERLRRSIMRLNCSNVQMLDGEWKSMASAIIRFLQGGWLTARNMIALDNTSLDTHGPISSLLKKPYD